MSPNCKNASSRDLCSQGAVALPATHPGQSRVLLLPAQEHPASRLTQPWRSQWNPAAGICFSGDPKPQLNLFLLLRHRLSLSPQPALIFTTLRGEEWGGPGQNNSDSNADSFAPLPTVTGQTGGSAYRYFISLGKSSFKNLNTPVWLFLWPGQRGEEIQME